MAGADFGVADTRISNPDLILRRGLLAPLRLGSGGFPVFRWRRAGRRGSYRGISLLGEFAEAGQGGGIAEFAESANGGGAGAVIWVSEELESAV
jgi:hypothetical protein